MQLRVSTTTIESYRRVIQTEYGNEDELVAKVIGKPWATTPKQAAGKAWHSIVEKFHDLSLVDEHCKMLGLTDTTKGMPVIEYDGYAFGKTIAEDANKTFGPGLWEVKATKVVETDMGPCTLVAKADHVFGTTVTDNKATFRSIDTWSYEPDLQWRTYLMVHNAQSFRYMVYWFAEPEEEEKLDGLKICRLKSNSTFRFYRHPGMEETVMHWLNEFLFWCKKRNIVGFLRREVED